MIERLPPHAEESERVVLGSMLLWWESCDRLRDLLIAEDFYAPIHRVIFTAIMAIHEGGRPVEESSTIYRLHDMGEAERCGGISYLKALQSVGCTPHSVDHYASDVRDKALQRKAIALAARNTSLLNDLGIEPIGPTLEAIQQEWVELAAGRQEEVARPFSEVLHETFTVLEERQEQKEQPAYKTGFSCFDNYVGGLQPGSLHILAARPTSGKTTLMLNWAINLAIAKTPVAIFSMEMKDKQLVVKAMASETPVSGHLLRLGRLEDNWQKVIDRAGEIRNIPLWICDRRGMALDELKGRIRRVVRQHRVRVVAVDYLTHIHVPRAESKRLEVVEITRSLSALAGDLGIALLLLAQISRQAEAREGQEPTLADLKESGSIEEDSDVVLFIHHPDKQPQAAGVKHLIVAKNRLGPAGAKLLVKWHPDYQRFQDVTDAERQGHEAWLNAQRTPKSHIRKGNSDDH